MLERGQAERLLTESLATLEWALAQAPERWHRPTPGAIPGDAWGVAMNLAHLAVYEERIGAPVLEALAAGGDAADAIPSDDEGWLDRDAARLSQEPIEAILARLRAARRRQIEAVRRTSDQRFATPLTPHWSGIGGTRLKSPAWVAAKTVQHTWEHGNTVMGIALFAPR